MKDSNKLGSNIHWVCFDCGIEALKNLINKRKKRLLISTYHNDRCDVCGQIKSVTEIRDYGYLIFK
jgi:hypothetical protein